MGELAEVGKWQGNGGKGMRKNKELMAASGMRKNKELRKQDKG
jgi:hypothetical protein